MFFKDKVYFKVKSLEESAYDMLRRFYTTTNPYETKLLTQLLNTNSPSFEICRRYLDSIWNYEVVKGENLIQKFETFWEINAKAIMEELQTTLNCNNLNSKQFLCFFDASPYMMVDYNNSTLSLSSSNSYCENLNTFLSFLVKFAVINKLWQGDIVKIDLTYSKDSAYWIMADFVADAICYHSNIDCLKIAPAYKYYYSLVINGENVVEKFRRDYLEMPIVDFIRMVLEFVRDNFPIFKQFCNHY